MALESYQEILKRFGDSEEVFIRHLVAKSLCNRGRVLLEVGNPQEARQCFEDFLKRFVDEGEPGFDEPISKAMLNMAEILGRCGEVREAREMLEQMLSRFGSSRDPDVAASVESARAFSESLPGPASDEARDRLARVAAFIDREEWPQALEVLEGLLRQYGDSDDPFLVEVVARGLYMKGTIQAFQGEPDAVKSFQAVVTRCGDRREPNLILPLAEARFALAEYWHHCRDQDRGLAACDAILEQHFAGPNPALSGLVAKTLSLKALLLRETDDGPAAMSTLQQLVERFHDHPDPNVALEVARARFNLASRLVELNDPAAPAALDDFLARYGQRSEPKLPVLVAATLVNKRLFLDRDGDTAGAHAVCEETLARFADWQEPDIIVLLLEMVLQHGRRRLEEGEASVVSELVEKAVMRYGQRTDPEVVAKVIAAMVLKAAALERLGLENSAVEEFDSIVTRYGSRSEPPIQEPMALSRLACAHCHLGRDRLDEARHVLNDLVRQYGENPHESLAFVVNKAKALLQNLSE
jgi:tetratricopeptide (TPR) repeat protein